MGTIWTEQSIGEPAYKRRIVEACQRARQAKQEVAVVRLAGLDRSRLVEAKERLRTAGEVA